MNNDSFWLKLIILLCFTPLLWGDSEVNLFTNNGFEEPLEGSNWSIKAWLDGYDVSRTTTKVYQGKYALKIDTEGKENDIRCIQNIAVKPGSFYKLSGWIATEEVRGPGIGGNLSLYGTPHMTGDKKGTSNWSYVEFIFKTAYQQKFVLIGGGIGVLFYGCASGTVYLDELSLVKLEKKPDKFLDLARFSEKGKKISFLEWFTSAKVQKIVSILIFFLSAFLIFAGSIGILYYKQKKGIEKLSPFKSLFLLAKEKYFPGRSSENGLFSRALLKKRGKTFVSKKNFIKKILIKEIRPYFRKKR